LIVVSIAAVIVVWTLALQIWDIATLTRSLFTLRGMLRLIAGAIVAFGALLLLYVSLPAAPGEVFSYLSIATFITALIVEFIIGDDLRSFFAGRR
jgi:hypothetical protein